MAKNQLVKAQEKQMLRGVYPELLRFAQDRSKWSERAQHDSHGDSHVRAMHAKHLVAGGKKDYQPELC